MKNFNEKVIAASAAFIVALTIFVFVLSDAVCDMIKAFRVEKKVELVIGPVLEPVLEPILVPEEPEELPLIEEEPEEPLPVEEDTPKYNLIVTDFFLKCKEAGYEVWNSTPLPITEQMKIVGVEQAYDVKLTIEGKTYTFKIVEFKEGIDAREGANKLVDLNPEVANSAADSRYHKNLAIDRSGTGFLLPIFESL